MVSTPIRHTAPTATPNSLDPWQGFASGEWTSTIDVRDFIQRNYAPYTDDEAFLAPATDRTQALWQQVSDLMKQERAHGILDVDTQVPSSITAHAPGYIDQSLEQIVGLQTDQPLKRAIMPNGGEIGRAHV